jgi:hypothetical protein
MIICYYSSFLFILNSIIAFYYNYYIYSLLFLFLTITSLLFHYNAYYYLIDQLAVYLLIFYGGYLFYTKFKLNICSVIILYSFIYTIFLFYGGYWLQ